MRGSTPGHVRSRLQTLLPAIIQRLPAQWAGNAMLPCLALLLLPTCLTGRGDIPARPNNQLDNS